MPVTDVIEVQDLSDYKRRIRTWLLCWHVSWSFAYMIKQILEGTYHQNSMWRPLSQQNAVCSQGRLNGHKVLSPLSSSPGVCGILLALFHKKAKIFLDSNRSRRTGRTQPVCLLMHQTKLNSWPLMEHGAFPCKRQHPLQWYPFPYPWFLMHNLKGKYSRNNSFCTWMVFHWVEMKLSNFNYLVSLRISLQLAQLSF